MPSRTVIVVPELLGELGPVFTGLADRGSVVKIPQVRGCAEALYLGLEEAEIADGPLTVAAFGADPPLRSLQFHLSLLSFSDGAASALEARPTEEELRLLLEQSEKLNTKLLTLVKGEGLDHGLVWEALGDLRTIAPAEIKGFKESLPEGDGEVLLRRYIDDSVNLLSEMELNRRREDEGLPPFNLLWPWGQGTRPTVQNLALARGEPAVVASEELRMQGLARLVGYRHVARGAYRTGLNLNFSGLAKLALETSLIFVVVSGAASLRSKGMLEELEWFVREMDTGLVEPLLASSSPRRVLLLAPSRTGEGLGLLFDSEAPGAGNLPFDERALESRGVETISSLVGRVMA